MQSGEGCEIMPEVPFEVVWGRIVKHQGEIFRTKTGLEFTYSIKGDYLYPSRTNYRISKADFMRVYDLLPVEGPGSISYIVRGPAYIWAILHDTRISLGAW